MAESDWFASERHIEIVDIILAVGFLIYLADNPPATLEAKFGKARLLLIVVFGAPIDMLLSLFYKDANTFC